MKSSLLAIRAVGAELADRIYTIVALIALAASAALMGLALWLTSLSQWWWLLVFVLIIWLSVVAGVLIIVKLVIKRVTPPLSRAQKKQTKAFVDKLQRLSEVTQTSKPVLLFRIVRDIAAPRENGFIASISDDTVSLKRDFRALGDTFRN